MAHSKRSKYIAALQVRRIDIGLIFQDKSVQCARFRGIPYLQCGRSYERDIRLEPLKALDSFVAKQVRAVKSAKRSHQKIQSGGARERIGIPHR
ncbi:hypothetical protein D3C75_809070 [compost metagenome]